MCVPNFLNFQVLEFLPLEYENEEMESPSALAAAICLMIIAATLTYQWYT